jgi:hypothetical protein
MIRFSGLILATAVACTPAIGLCQDAMGTPPEQWLTCFAATKLHQDAMAGSGRFSLNLVMQAGEPRLRYQRLAKAWLANVKKLDGDAVAGEMVRAPADMKKSKTMAQIEDVARTCTEHLPDLSNPAFYAKYDFLREEANGR